MLNKQQWDEQFVGYEVFNNESNHLEYADTVAIDYMNWSAIPKTQFNIGMVTGTVAGLNDLPSHVVSSSRIRCDHCGQLNYSESLECRCCGAPIYD